MSKANQKARAEPAQEVVQEPLPTTEDKKKSIYIEFVEAGQFKVELGNGWTNAYEIKGFISELNQIAMQGLANILKQNAGKKQKKK